MKFKIAIIAIFWLLVSVDSAFSKENFEQIYSNNLKARGGDSLIASLKSFIITGELIREDSIHFVFRAAYKVPGKSVIEYYLNGDTLAIGYDGKSNTGWTIMPQLSFNTIELPKEKVEESVALTVTPIFEYFNQLDKYQKQKNKVTVADGTDSVNNIPNYKLICQGKGSEAEIIFVNKTDYLISQINSSFTVGGLTQPAIITLNDYRNINNIMIPHHIKIYNSNTSISEITVQTIEINPPLEDIIFQIPGDPEDIKNRN